MKNLNSKNGIAAIAVILIIVVVAVGGGAIGLGIRSAVTGESYFAPFMSEEEEVADESTLYQLFLYPDSLTYLLEEAYESEAFEEFVDEFEAEDEEFDIEDYELALDFAEDILAGVDGGIEITANENDIEEVYVYLNYEDALANYYDYVMANAEDEEEIEDEEVADEEEIEETTEDLEEEEIEDEDYEEETEMTYEEFKEEFYEKIDEAGVNEDGVVSVISDLLEKMEITDYTDSEIAEAVDFMIDEEDGAIYCLIDVPDEINEYISDYVAENLYKVDEVVDDLTEYGIYVDIDISEDSYLEDCLKVVASFLDDAALLFKDGEAVDIPDIGISVYSMGYYIEDILAEEEDFDINEFLDDNDIDVNDLLAEMGIDEDDVLEETGLEVDDILADIQDYINNYSYETEESEETMEE